jgi:glycosyltransferase involved in cell wall biosynthesis
VTRVHVVLPGDIDDPARPSGGNHYDRRVCRELTRLGWSVREHPVPGGWPAPTRADLRRLGAAVAALPAGAVVLVDGLVASAAAEVLLPQAHRLRLVVLVHLPFGGDGEAAVLRGAAAVVVTSEWTAGHVTATVKPVHVAPPGVDPAPVAPGSAAGTNLLCVAAVARHKGHDVLVRALTDVVGRSWSCHCVGTLDREPDFVAVLRRAVAGAGLADRLHFTGPRTGGELAASYAAADLVVLPSRGETYGMVVTEALARGIPVLGTAVGGVPEAVGRAPDGSVPALLVRPDDAGALAAALRRWLDEPDLRARLRAGARARRGTLTDWSVTARRVAAALTEAA